MLAVLLLLGSSGCNFISESDKVKTCECDPSTLFVSDSTTHQTADTSITVGVGALLASRFHSLQDLKSVIQIEYADNKEVDERQDEESPRVRSIHCSNGREVISILRSGVNEGDFGEAHDGDFWDRLGLLFSSPYAVMNRRDLQRVYLLSRRRRTLFGEGDVAFYDLAETSEKNITTKDLAYWHPRDSSEKGYINTFNHITAQAFMTSLFSERMADFVADVHERLHMPELMTGRFTEDQLSDPNTNPVDNYVDIVNNEWGQELGKQLSETYHIDRNTYWTPQLLANYLNDLQTYYSWAFQIGFQPYRPEDELVIRFSNKINRVMQEGPIALE